MHGVCMTKTFDNWTSYDDWLIENYPLFNIQDVKEVQIDGATKIQIECTEKPQPAAKTEEKK